MNIIFPDEEEHPEIWNALQAFLKTEKLVQELLGDPGHQIGDYAHGWIVDNPKDEVEDRFKIFSCLADYARYVQGVPTALVIKANFPENYYIFFSRNSDTQNLIDMIANAAGKALADAIRTGK